MYNHGFYPRVIWSYRAYETLLYALDTAQRLKRRRNAPMAFAAKGYFSHAVNVSLL